MDKLKAFILKLNEMGIPLPLLRDNKIGRGSVTYTFFVVSGLLTFLGLIGKAGHFLDIDTQQCIYWFLTCSGIYLGRTIASNGKSVTINESSK